MGAWGQLKSHFKRRMQKKRKHLYEDLRLFMYLCTGGKIFDGFLHSVTQNQHLAVAAPPWFTPRAAMVLLVRSLSQSCTYSTIKKMHFKNDVCCN